MDRVQVKGIEIIQAQTPEHLRAIVSLLRDFVRWQRERYFMDLWFVDGYFESSAWEEELAHLDSKYAAPEGALLLACKQGRPAGCIAMRRLEAGVCEMKRLFVRPEYQGHG